jgi:thiamine biosynthesis lipoprotein
VTAAGVGARLVFPVMGTVSTVTVPEHELVRVGRDVVDEALHAARLELERMDLRFSHYRLDSDISRWTAGDDVSDAATADIEHVLRECGRLHRDSDGVFRARNPRTNALDTAGYVKGYAIGLAADEMRGHGLMSFSVGVGGDAAFAGRPDDSRPWQVAIQHPGRRFGIVAVIPVIDGAVATSGTAERGDHIWLGDRPAARASARSFTVIGPDIAEADAYATIGFAMGEAGMEWVRSHEGYRSLVVRTDGTVRSDAALVSAA